MDNEQQPSPRAARPPGCVDGVALAPLTTLELGGAATHYLRVEELDELTDALAWSRSEEIQVTVLGGGSNVVIADSGVAGLVLHMGLRGVSMETTGDSVLVTARAGEPWDEVVERAVADNLAGIECLSGIPGSVGAVPIQNVGAYGQEVSQVIEHVRAVEQRSGREILIPAAECGFGYRRSHFRGGGAHWIIVELGLRLQRGGPPAVAYPELVRQLGDGAPSLAEVRAAILELRGRKSMLIRDDDENRRSAGSFFVNPVFDAAGAEALTRRAVVLGAARSPAEVPLFPAAGGKLKLSAAWLVERAGFPKGTRRGAVGVSSRHALALVHHGGGRSAELLGFAAEIVAAVADRFGIVLHPEPVFLGFGEADPLSGAHSR